MDNTVQLPSTNSKSPARIRILRRWRLRVMERGVLTVLGACAAVSVLTTIGIVSILSLESLVFFRDVPLKEFFLSLDWSPLLDPRHFGIWPLVCGTLLVAVGAGLIAIPVGLGTAIFLAEYASSRLRMYLKPMIELLAGIPTVVYGYFGVTTVTPALTKVFGFMSLGIAHVLVYLDPSLVLTDVADEILQVEVFNALSAAIVVGIMILPTITSLCDDAIRSVPDHLRDGGAALGATKLEVTTQILIPASLSGIFSAFILALARAFGETMAVALAAGSTPRLTLNPLQSIQTMTSYIVQVSMGDTPHGSIEYQSIFVVGMSLFLITAAMNMTAFYISRKYRVVYD